MAVFPTIIVNNPAVTITTNNPVDLSYQQVVQNIGYTSYKINTLYLLSADAGAAQITQPLTLTTPSPNGENLIYPYSPAIDSYQYQNSLFFNPDDNFILSQLATLQFDILPNASLEMIFYYQDSSSFNFLLPTDSGNNNSIEELTSSTDNSNSITQKGDVGKKVLIAVAAVTLSFFLLKIFINAVAE